MPPPDLRELRELVTQLRALHVHTDRVDDAIATAIAHPDSEVAQLDANARLWLVTARESHRLLAGELCQVEALLDTLSPTDADRQALERIQRAFTVQLEGLDALLAFLASGDLDALRRAERDLHAGAALVASQQ